MIRAHGSGNPLAHLFNRMTVFHTELPCMAVGSADCASENLSVIEPDQGRSLGLLTAHIDLGQNQPMPPTASLLLGQQEPKKAETMNARRNIDERDIDRLLSALSDHQIAELFWPD